MLTRVRTDHTPTKTGRDGVFVNAEILFVFHVACYRCSLDLRLGYPSALKPVSLKGLEGTGHRALTKTETGPCSVDPEMLCSESFKTRWCKTRGTSLFLGV